jgi:hypothetical protein
MIVGLSGYSREGRKFQELLEVLIPDWEDNECYSGHGVFDVAVETTIEVLGGDEPSYIGIPIEKLLEQNLTLSQLRELFIREAKKLGVEIDPRTPQLLYGEVGTG